MGPLGFQEIVLIVIVALLVFGPKRLPEVARTVGRSLSLLRKATDDVKDTLTREVEETQVVPSPSSPNRNMPSNPRADEADAKENVE